MADDESLASDYQVLEELGRESTLVDALLVRTTNVCLLGGSFGVVYKGIDKITGETVAIKHVRPALDCLFSWPLFQSHKGQWTNGTVLRRLILSPAMMIFKTSRPRLLSSVPAPAPT